VGTTPGGTVPGGADDTGEAGTGEVTTAGRAGPGEFDEGGGDGLLLGPPVCAWVVSGIVLRASTATLTPSQRILERFTDSMDY